MFWILPQRTEKRHRHENVSRYKTSFIESLRESFVIWWHILFVRRIYSQTSRHRPGFEQQTLNYIKKKKKSKPSWGRRLSVDYKLKFRRVFFPGTFLEKSTLDDRLLSGTLSETNRKCAEPCEGLSAPLLLLQVGWRFPVWCHATLLYIEACGDALLSYIGMHKTLPHFYFLHFFFEPHLLLESQFFLICFHQKCTGYLFWFQFFSSI